MLRYRFVDIPYNGHVIRYVRKSLKQPRFAPTEGGRPLLWTEERVEQLIVKLEESLGVVVLVDHNIMHSASVANREVTEAFMAEHGRIKEAPHAWEHTALELELAGA